MNNEPHDEPAPPHKQAQLRAISPPNYEQETWWSTLNKKNNNEIKNANFTLIFQKNRLLFKVMSFLAAVVEW